MIYLIGSLRNPEIPKIAAQLREAKIEVFDDWYAAGPEADDKWREYEQGRGRSYIEALSGHAACHVFHFDLTHLNRASGGILVLPAGKSGHLEIGYLVGRGRWTGILLESVDRWDVMYKFANAVSDRLENLIDSYLSRGAVERTRPTDSDHRQALQGGLLPHRTLVESRRYF